MSQAGQFKLCIFLFRKQKLQINLHSFPMQRSNKSFQALPRMLRIHRILRLHSHKICRSVSPIIFPLVLLSVLRIHCFKIVDRHQLQRIHTQFFQIRNLLGKPFKGSPTFYSGRSMLCKAADMKLIQNNIVKIQLRRNVSVPVEGLFFKQINIFSGHPALCLPVKHRDCLTIT